MCSRAYVYVAVCMNANMYMHGNLINSVVFLITKSKSRVIYFRALIRVIHTTIAKTEGSSASASLATNGIVTQVCGVPRKCRRLY